MREFLSPSEVAKTDIPVEGIKRSFLQRLHRPVRTVLGGVMMFLASEGVVPPQIFAQESPQGHELVLSPEETAARIILPQEDNPSSVQVEEAPAEAALAEEKLTPQQEEAITVLQIPVATLEITPKPTAMPIIVSVPEPTPAVGPVTFNYDVGSGVANADIKIIREGISLAQAELQSNYGGDIRRPVNNPLRVKIVADGTGEGCCSALDPLDPLDARIFLDVKHRFWGRAYMGNIGQKIIAAHEYTHAWHNSLGCLTLHNHLLPDWLEEGTATFIPTGGLIRAGTLNNQVERYFNYASAKGSGQLSVPLRLLEHPAPIYPGHVGYLAVERLIAQAPSAYLSLRTICESVGSGSNLDQAFQSVFGQSISNFYESFPAYIQSLERSPVYLALVGRLPQEQGSDPNKIAFKFNYAAYGYEDLTQAQQIAAWILPPEMCGFGSELLGEMNIALCNTVPRRSYPIILQLPHGRRAQVDITIPARG